jgi:two-component system response regulator VanR
MNFICGLCGDRKIHTKSILLCYNPIIQAEDGFVMNKILIIEDEIDIQELLCAYLQDAGYKAAAESDGIAGLDRFNQENWNLVLLDLMLPKIDGYAVCELIRKKSDVPIIMLTALDGEANQLKGYDLRIDDYVTKPFSMTILLRKIEAVLRRYGSEAQSDLLLYKDISVNLDSYEVFVSGERIDLTSREYSILRQLIEHPGKVYTRTILLDSLWGYDYFGDERIVDSHMKNLRKKLDRDYIETVRGVGYRVAKIN